MGVNNNNTEIEAKILEVSHTELESKIMKLGGKKIFDGILDAVWLKNHDKRDEKGKIIEEGKKIRVRKEGTKVVTEYKEKQNNENGFKQCLEIGYSSDSFDNQIEVLERLGFRQESRSIKRRVSFLIKNNSEFGNVQLDFDKYSQLGGLGNIPELLEIEAISDEVIIKVANLLGFSKKDLLDWNAGDLLKHYTKKIN